MSETESTNPVPPTKAEIIHQISKALMERRKARGLSLDKIHQNIKIRIPYLEAIEKGEWDELPGEVYVKGFLKRYADHLGFDSGKLLAPYFQLGEAPTKKNVESAPLLKGGEFHRLHLVVFGLVALLIIVFFQMVKKEARVPVKPVPPPLLATDPPSPVTEKSAEVQAPVSINQSHRLDVFSPNPLWLRVTTQDRNFEGFIPQSSTWSWKGQGHFSIRLGHTKDLVLYFDGEPVLIAENQKKVELPNEN